MFSRSARYYDDIYAFKNYARETAKIANILAAHFGRPAISLLDVACGTGRHLEYFRPWTHVEGIDINEDLLALARRRLPDTPLHVGDMRSFDLGRQFECVTCLFSAIAAMPDVASLNRAIATMAAHVAPGGLLIIEPWWPPDNWLVDGKPRAQWVDKDGLKIARMSMSGRDGDTSTIAFHYLVASRDGFETFREDHRYSLFSKDDQTSAFRAAGLEVEHDPDGLTGRGLYIGRKASPSPA